MLETLPGVLVVPQVKIVIVRSGTAILVHCGDSLPVVTGDVIVFPTRATARFIPLRLTHLSCILLDSEYAVDLVYWQYRSLLNNRDEAQAFANMIYPKPRSVLSLAEHLPALGPMLDRMASISRELPFHAGANMLQELWFSFAGLATRSTSTSPHLLAVDTTRDVASMLRNIATEQVATAPVVRGEVLAVFAMLHDRPEHPWRLSELAAAVHLSPGHLTELCVQAWGHTPHAQLTRERVEKLAEHLATTLLPVKECVQRVGWRNHSYAVRVFRSMMGLSPSEYRAAAFGYPSVTSGHRSEGQVVESQESCPSNRQLR